MHLLGYGVDPKGWGHRPHRATGINAVDKRAVGERPEVRRFRDRSLNGCEAAGDRINLLFVTGKTEQRGGVPPC